MSTKALARPISYFPSLFDEMIEPWNDWFSRSTTRMTELPAVNIIENEKDFTVQMAAPGLKKDDFRIDVNNNLLTISAETEEDKKTKEENYTRREYSYTSFTRSFNLPENTLMNDIKAKYEDGVLKLVIPKKLDTTKPASTKHINVQ